MRSRVSTGTSGSDPGGIADADAGVAGAGMQRRQRHLQHSGARRSGRKSPRVVSAAHRAVSVIRPPVVMDAVGTVGRVTVRGILDKRRRVKQRSRFAIHSGFGSQSYVYVTHRKTYFKFLPATIKLFRIMKFRN